MILIVDCLQCLFSFLFLFFLGGGGIRNWFGLPKNDLPGWRITVLLIHDR
jgi:hypothetical protein